MPNTTGPTKSYNAIPVPEPTVEGLLQSVLALKEAVEVLTRQRMPVTAAAVTWQDLVDLGLILKTRLPVR